MYWSKYFIRITLLVVASAMNATVMYASNVVNPGSYDHVAQEAELTARHRLEPLLEKYCGNYCTLIDVRPEVEEEVPVTDDIGFESAVGQGVKPNLFVRRITAEVQIDNRVGSVNQERLGKILQINLRPVAVEPVVQWQVVAMPNIKGELPYIPPTGDVIPEGESTVPYNPPAAKLTPMSEQSLRVQLESRISRAMANVIDRYCPDQCVLERIGIDSQVIDIKGAKTFPNNQVVIDETGQVALRVDNVDIEVSMDENLPQDTREQITAIMRSRTKFVSPVNLNVATVAFPETTAKKRDREKTESEDPYGLEKLRQMLIMFRDLAGTKEIITSNSVNSNSESRVRESVDSRSISSLTNSSNTNTNTENNSSSTSKETARQTDTNSTTAAAGLGGFSKEELGIAVAGFILLLMIVAIVLIKVSKTNRDAREMMMIPTMAAPAAAGGMARRADSGMDGGEGGFEGEAGMGEGAEGARPAEKSNVNWAVRNRELKDEIIDSFIEHPKIAKDVFARFLKEDGVEATAKYVQIFGQLVIFPLIDDTNFQRELYDLSEFYHNANIRLSFQEEYELLMKLKTRMTASEIRVLTRKDKEKFDFLQKLDPGQIYTLVKDENMQIQSIVLAQLDPKRRRAVFDMYQGDAKIQLMSQLSMSDAIPKEFMANVAKALAKKVAKRPEYDTENIRSSDVLLDLLEKSALAEQRELMATLQKQNPDTARSLLMKLVTVETMAFLKDGHLLELVLGMDRRDLLIFLMGAADHLRDLLLRKAPEELSSSWVEDIESMGAVDEQTFRMVELKILNRIRSLANNGVISLLDLNTIIFADNANAGDFKEEAGINLANKYVSA